MNESQLISLSPRWIEFTGTPGALRSLKPQDEAKRAMGLVFKCPKCLGDKEKDHFIVFLFERPGVPEAARPQGRFIPDTFSTLNHFSPVPFDRLSLRESLKTGPWNTFLKPRDIPCRWEGYLDNGKVSWKSEPNPQIKVEPKRSFLKRVFSK